MFSLGPFTVHWYGFMMALSFLTGCYLLIKNGVKEGLNEEALWTLCVLWWSGDLQGPG